MKKQGYRIALRNGDTRTVHGYIHASGLATRRYASTNVWVIDHVYSGHAISYTFFRTRRGALQAIEEIATLWDWANNWRAIDHNADIGQQIRTICDIHQKV